MVGILKHGKRFMGTEGLYETICEECFCDFVYSIEDIPESYPNAYTNCPECGHRNTTFKIFRKRRED